MLNCQQIPELTSALLDDQLSGYQRWQVKLHLFLCHHCRDYWRALKSTVTALGSYRERASEQQIEHIVALIKSQQHSRPTEPKK